MIICHVSSGGAYKIAQMYATFLQLPLTIKPGITKLVKYLFKENNKKLIIFHSPNLAFKQAWIIRLFSPTTKIYCVEHFILPQIIRYEFDASFKRKLYILMLRINSLMGVKIICLDDYSIKARQKLINNRKIKIIPNPIETKIEQNAPSFLDKPFDLIWAAGLSAQKKWPEALAELSHIKKENPSLRIAIASYDQPSPIELAVMDEMGFSFFKNKSDWHKLASCFFFSSNYEGFPLALVEAITHNMYIIAWCHRSCVKQILRHYPHHIWIPASQPFNRKINLKYNKPSLEQLPDSFLHWHSKKNIKNLLKML